MHWNDAIGPCQFRRPGEVQNQAQPCPSQPYLRKKLPLAAEHDCLGLFWAWSNVCVLRRSSHRCLIRNLSLPELSLVLRPLWSDVEARVRVPLYKQRCMRHVKSRLGMDALAGIEIVRSTWYAFHACSSSIRCNVGGIGSIDDLTHGQSRIRNGQQRGEIPYSPCSSQSFSPPHNARPPSPWANNTSNKSDPGASVMFLHGQMGRESFTLCSHSP